MTYGLEWPKQTSMVWNLSRGGTQGVSGTDLLTSTTFSCCFNWNETKSTTLVCKGLKVQGRFYDAIME